MFNYNSTGHINNYNFRYQNSADYEDFSEEAEQNIYNKKSEEEKLVIVPGVIEIEDKFDNEKDSYLDKDESYFDNNEEINLNQKVTLLYPVTKFHDNVTKVIFNASEAYSTSDLYNNVFIDELVEYFADIIPHTTNDFIIDNLYQLTKVDYEKKYNATYFQKSDFEELISNIYEKGVEAKLQFKKYLMHLVKNKSGIDDSFDIVEDNNDNAFIQNDQVYEKYSTNDNYGDTEEIIKNFMNKKQLSQKLENDDQIIFSDDDFTQYMWGDDGNIGEEKIETKTKIDTSFDSKNKPLEKAIKTFDTPSGRVKILFQVDENESSNNKIKAVSNDRFSNKVEHKNTNSFYQESEKNKVSAVMTPDGKIALLVKSKNKESLDNDKYEKNSKSKWTPNQSDIKTTFLQPVPSSNPKQEIEKTMLQPVGANVWTTKGMVQSPIEKVKSKLDDLPYDDDYYDSEDEFNPEEFAKITTTSIELQPTTTPTTITIFTETTTVKDVETTQSHEHIKIPERFDKSGYEPNKSDILEENRKTSTWNQTMRSENSSADSNRNRNSDYAKNHVKSVYMNILDILGPDSKDVIQLLNDVKKEDKPARRTNKQYNDDNKTVFEKVPESKENIPIFHKVENNSKKPTDSEVVDQQTQTNNDVFIEHSNSNDVWKQKSGKELDDLWAIDEDDLTEESGVRIIPVVDTRHTILEKIDSNRPKDSFLDKSITQDRSDQDLFSSKFDIKNNMGFGTSSGNHQIDSSKTFILSIISILGFGTYTISTWLVLKLEHLLSKQ